MDDFSLRFLLKSLVLPPTGPLLLAFLGLALAFTAKRRLGISFLTLGLVSLWLLSTPIIANELVAWRQYSQALDLSKPIDAQAIVILAGGARRKTREYGGPTPEQRTLQRLVYGARVARKSRLPVLITGGKVETTSMAAVLREDFGIQPRWIESVANSTHENAQFSQALLAKAHITRIVLVTSALHMQRAISEFRSEGFTVTAAPVDVRVLSPHTASGLIPEIFALRDSEYVVYEALGGLARAAAELLEPDR
ncbi:MAG: YdcF family protein [Steroidobacteraceae bacterium]